MQYKISASILTVDFLSLRDELESVYSLVDEIHLDICDGHLVPSLSFGANVVQSIRNAFPTAFLDTHLMIENPHNHWQSFLDAGSNSLIFHYEASLHPLVLRNTIQAHHAQVGIALAPRSNALVLEPLIGFFDRILIMTVNPGFGGQKMIPAMLRKVEQARELLGDEVDIIVDGGINLQRIGEARRAGANVFVVGNALFQNSDRKSFLEDIRAALS